MNDEQPIIDAEIVDTSAGAIGGSTALVKSGPPDREEIRRKAFERAARVQAANAPPYVLVTQHIAIGNALKAASVACSAALSLAQSYRVRGHVEVTQSAIFRLGAALGHYLSPRVVRHDPRQLRGFIYQGPPLMRDEAQQDEYDAFRGWSLGAVRPDDGPDV
jgi:hypothetical protein